MEQFIYAERCFDFHNDFYCFDIKVDLDNQTLVFYFHNASNIVKVIFLDAVLVKSNFDLYGYKYHNLTLDTLYRGRFESDAKLLDLSEKKAPYFYASFEEGEELEFFAKYLYLEITVI